MRSENELITLSENSEYCLRARYLESRLKLFLEIAGPFCLYTEISNNTLNGELQQAFKNTKNMFTFLQNPANYTVSLPKK